MPRVFKTPRHKEIALEAVFSQVASAQKHAPHQKASTPGGEMMVHEDPPASVFTPALNSLAASMVSPPTECLRTPVFMLTASSSTEELAALFVFDLKPTIRTMVTLKNTPTAAAPLSEQDVTMDEYTALSEMESDTDNLFNFRDVNLSDVEIGSTANFISI
ncbi:uncharacterized protein BT62DRAFT_923328 [Guyanagaster necrorhizus]|uniref:Uncharacterized protein n=1 Tax=Guyanagaster necrorhizus TaxID=856835 RepID=A0A9P7VIK5_9AGAR|nr:uncharacterized protein BT62DRAFT_923328 [Guyanagaster necrorhizus MCA 3950]KAG7441354.1 hypothetical protein BT62DRAFT_923328 [Guyanagaster necrorhizus MCA 3950]